MAEIKLTKNELRIQQIKLAQLSKYLPTLQLKKAMLQTQVNEVRSEILALEKNFHEMRQQVAEFSSLLSLHTDIDIHSVAKVDHIVRRFENIAGVEIPLYEGVVFFPVIYNLFTTPAWVDPAITEIRGMAESKAELIVAEERKAALEKELREVSIRVNLFEKNLIPKAMQNIKKIKIFLGDQQLAAVSQAKVAKTKIEERKEVKKEKKPKDPNFQELNG